MIIPHILSKGDTVGIVSTARKISKDEINPAVNLIQFLGYKVKFSKHLFGEYHQFSGTDEERASDLMNFFQDDAVSVILCARGGYGTVRLLPYLDLKVIKKNPKYLIGYSDVTVLHSLLNREGIASIHGSMPINFKDYNSLSPSITSLFDLLEGNRLNYSISSHPFNREGKAQAELVGGNLSMLYSLRGTSVDINTKGKILFIEDLDEYLYHVDRMMMNLKIGGYLDEIEGLIVGGMSDMNDNAIPFGKNAIEIILETVRDSHFPVMFGFPAGHIHDNYALPFGRIIKMDVSSNSVVINMEDK